MTNAIGSVTSSATGTSKYIPELAVHNQRMAQTGHLGKDMGAWALLVYGTKDDVYGNINFAIGGDYMQDTAWTSSTDQPGTKVYGDDGTNDAMIIDQINGTATHTTLQQLAADSGIGSDDGTQNYSYALWGAGSLQFVANQDAEGVAPGSVSYDLTQSAFSSKWASEYVVNNVDFTKVVTSGNPTDYASAFATNIFAQSMYTIGQWGSLLDVQTLNSATSQADYYAKAIQLLRTHAFPVPEM